MFPLSFLLCLYTAEVVVAASKCAQDGKSSCICSEAGGGIVNLTLLAQPDAKGSAGLVTPGSTTKYYYNPCTPFTLYGSKKTNVCTPDQDVAVCQLQDDIAYNAGTESTAVFSGSSETRDLSITFTAPSGTSTTRISIVKLVCKDKLPLSDSTLTFEKEDPADTYNLILTSKCCCPDLCQTKPEPSSSSGHGLSIGSILLIVFFSLIFVYILCGILYLKFVRGASGVELIPNYSFWALLPSLIKEGVVFLIGKCRGQDTSSTQYEKI